MAEQAHPERVNNGCMIYRDDTVYARTMRELDRQIRQSLGILPPRWGVVGELANDDPPPWEH